MFAQLLVEFDNHAIYQRLIDRLRTGSVVQNVGNKGGNALLGNTVTLIDRADTGLCHDFVQQGRGGYTRPRLNLFFDQRHVFSFLVNQSNLPITRQA
ncbi:hypothetical protein LAJPDJIK_00836 [Aeromonas salmonicida]